MGQQIKNQEHILQYVSKIHNELAVFLQNNKTDEQKIWSNEGFYLCLLEF